MRIAVDTNDEVECVRHGLTSRADGQTQACVPCGDAPPRLAPVGMAFVSIWNDPISHWSSHRPLHAV